MNTVEMRNMSDKPCISIYLTADCWVLKWLVAAVEVHSTWEDMIDLSRHWPGCFVKILDQVQEARRKKYTFDHAYNSTENEIDH